MDGGGGTKALVVLNRDGPCLGGCPGLERIVRVVVEVCEGARSLPSSLYRNSRVASVASGFQKGLSVEWPLFAKNNGGVESSGRWLESVTRFVKLWPHYNSGHEVRVSRVDWWPTTW